MLSCPVMFLLTHAPLKVRVVGQYSQEGRRGSAAYFFLNDGSGTLYCSCTLEDNDAMQRVFNAAETNKSYLCVVGKVKPGNTGLFVYHARLVTDYNEMTHHAIECIYEGLKAAKAAAHPTPPAHQPLQLPGHRVYPDRQVSTTLIEYTQAVRNDLDTETDTVDLCGCLRSLRSLCSRPQADRARFHLRRRTAPLTRSTLHHQLPATTTVASQWAV